MNVTSPMAPSPISAISHHQNEVATITRISSRDSCFGQLHRSSNSHHRPHPWRASRGAGDDGEGGFGGSTRSRLEATNPRSQCCDLRFRSSELAQPYSNAMVSMVTDSHLQGPQSAVACPLPAKKASKHARSQRWWGFYRHPLPSSPVVVA